MKNINMYKSVEIDSRKCVKNSIFIVLDDKYANNRFYVADAINNGASLIISEKYIDCSVKVLRSKNIYKYLIKLLNYFYPYSSKLIGVTGTDGKTSTCLMIKSLINQNSTCGYIGTNGIIFNNKKYKTINTTPDIITIRKYLYKMSQEDIKYVVMECSSEGILMNRLISLKFDSLIYTNISHEHLNTHKTMENYISTKLSLLKYLEKNGTVIVNADDLFLHRVKCKNKITYGIHNGKVRATNIETYIDKTSFSFLSDAKKDVTIPFFGKYNIYNCLASLIILENYNLFNNIDFRYMHKIDGRFEVLRTIDKEVIIDFAHTPNALENLLKNIKEVTKKKIILVMGSAGNKDKSKRPLLGYVADKYATKIIITSEDPKNELITNIFCDIIEKIKKEYYLVLFRKDAIKLGLELLDKNSILVIVGKGLENYEQIYNIKFPHNDYLYTKSLLNS